MAKKIPKEYKPGQSILVKLSGGRIVEARVNHLIQTFRSSLLPHESRRQNRQR